MIYLAAGQDDEALRIADYAAVTQAGYPAYLGVRSRSTPNAGFDARGLTKRPTIR